MIWAKRRFKFANYAPYQERLRKLSLQNPGLHSQFIMVSIGTDARGESDYYVGVPDQTFLADFDGFEIVHETDLPREIDAVLYADQSSENFTRRFRLRKRLH
jgi:hypothetical protein